MWVLVNQGCAAHQCNLSKDRDKTQLALQKSGLFHDRAQDMRLACGTSGRVRRLQCKRKGSPAHPNITIALLILDELSFPCTVACELVHFCHKQAAYPAHGRETVLTELCSASCWFCSVLLCTIKTNSVTLVGATALSVSC